MRRLSFAGNHRLDFTGIGQPWLGELVKRWLRWRLSTGLGLKVGRRGLRCLTRFAQFCQRIRFPLWPRLTRTCWNATWPTYTRSWPARRPHWDNSTHFCTASGNTHRDTTCRPPR